MSQANPKTTKEMLLVLDRFFVTAKRLELLNMWTVLTALRSLDPPVGSARRTRLAQAKLKEYVVCPVRSATFPRASRHSDCGVGFLQSSVPLPGEKERQKLYRKAKACLHYVNHAESAIRVLEELGHISVEGKTRAAPKRQRSKRRKMRT